MIPLFKVFMNIDTKPVQDTLQSGIITQNKKVEEFENNLKKWFSFDYILTLNSATSGLTLALRLLNLQQGDEVLCTPLTCFATTCAVLANNLNIKWVDVDSNTCNMDLNDLKQKISSKTKAILFVHWGGSPIDLDKLKEISGNIPIVEDCAHAFGAEYKGKKIGCHGNICVFSLQAIKHLTTGDGGLIFLPNEELYNRAKLLRWFGIDRERPQINIDSRLENNIVEWGYKFHMNDINATIGLCNLPFVEKNLEIIRRNAKFYDEHLNNLVNIKVLNKVDNALSAYWIYTVKVKNKNNFIEFMTNRKITVSQVHKRNDVNDCVKQYRCSLPNMDELDNEIVSIPVGWWLTQENIEYIVKCIQEWSELQYEIRLLKKEDKTEYLNLLFQLNNHICSLEKFDKVFKGLNSSNKIYVLTINNKIVSSAKVIYEPKFYDDIAHIEDVITDKEYRKCGYASLLIKTIIKEAQNKGCYKIVLNANDDIYKFYEKNGFLKKGVEMSLKFNL